MQGARPLDQGYYKWLKAPVSQRDWDDAHVINALHEIHQDDPTLGYRCLTDELADLPTNKPPTRLSTELEFHRIEGQRSL